MSHQGGVYMLSTHVCMYVWVMSHTHERVTSTIEYGSPYIAHGSCPVSLESWLISLESRFIHVLSSHFTNCMWTSQITHTWRSHVPCLWSHGSYLSSHVSLMFSGVMSRTVSEQVMPLTYDGVMSRVHQVMAHISRVMAHVARVTFHSCLRSHVTNYTWKRHVTHIWQSPVLCLLSYGVASFGRIDEIIGLFCKRAL